MSFSEGDFQRGNGKVLDFIIEIQPENLSFAVLVSAVKAVGQKARGVKVSLGDRLLPLAQERKEVRLLSLLTEVHAVVKLR